MLKRFIIALVLVSFWFTSSVFAAGEGNLNMLGFSSDSQYFVLIESVIEDGSGIPTAKIIIAEVATNKCVRGGCFSTEGSEEDEEQQVLSKIYKKTWKLRKKLKLTPPRRGYQAKGPLFDKKRKTNYYVYGNQKIYVKLEEKAVPGPYEFQEKAAVQLTVNAVGKKSKVTKVLDSLKNHRQDAQKYELGDLFFSPDKNSIAILVRVFYRGFEGADIRTIVQTAKLF
jgi:predicted secreted protein